ncbi:MAG: rod shape-determining protein MreC, partial [Candidatus Andersenbacteria bacterium]
RPIDTFRNQLTINRGSRHGVTPGAPVVIHSSTLIGFITDLYEETSIDQLLIHPATSLAAEIANETAPRGLLVGRHYTSLAITTVPQDAKLESGQKVVSSSREGLPQGLLIGTIGAVKRQENEAYQEAAVMLPYDPDSLRAVTILVLP